MEAVEITKLFGGWVFPILGSIILAVINLRPKKGTLENQLIQNYQVRSEAQEQKIASQSDLIDELRAAGRLKDDYISELRRQIEDREGPPPKPWPKELL